MARRERQLLVHSRSAFLQVKCAKCGAERVVYSHCTVTAKCEVCGEVLAEPRGGLALIRGVVVKRLD